MTPREKWRKECIQFLVAHDWAEWKIERYDDARLKRLVEDQLSDTTTQANYLLIEYLNVKTSDDEKGTEISNKK